MVSHLIVCTNKEDVLSVSAEKRFDSEKKERDYKRIEHTYGYFSRSVRLPKNVDTSKLTASLENGILKVQVPKTQADEGAKEIKISTDNE